MRWEEPTSRGGEGTKSPRGAGPQRRVAPIAAPLRSRAHRLSQDATDEDRFRSFVGDLPSRNQRVTHHGPRSRPAPVVPRGGSRARGHPQAGRLVPGHRRDGLSRRCAGDPYGAGARAGRPQPRRLHGPDAGARPGEHRAARLGRSDRALGDARPGLPGRGGAPGGGRDARAGARGAACGDGGAPGDARGLRAGAGTAGGEPAARRQPDGRAGRGAAGGGRALPGAAGRGQDAPPSPAGPAGARSTICASTRSASRSR